MPNIERASESDIPALGELLSVLFTQEAEFEPDLAAQCKGLSIIIRNPDVGIILVAREQANILGMVSLLFTVSTALGERVALLEDMIVAPQARSAGVGSLLLQHAKEVARKHGVKRITLLTDGENTAAQRFYVRQGFSCSTMIPFRLSLD